MKKKIVFKWLLRMPVLCLALILAVMPLCMAVPSYANVLESGTVYVAELGDMSCIYDYDFPNILCVSYANLSSVSLFCSDSPIIVNNYGQGISINSESALYQAIIFLPDGLTLDFRGVPLQRLWSLPHIMTNVGIVLGAGNFAGDYSVVLVSPRVYSQNVGMLSVFTGVGSWLSGAVQNISTMFWTAETGMTVLGYLAVASLALAVILLIFYLIAGWLKFH